MALQNFLDNNRRWVEDTLQRDPDFFLRLSGPQHPTALWIGCSDARVPANIVTGSESGEIFVHRNIANQVFPMDSNLQAVLEFAVEALKVTDVIVCGHSGCGGVRAAMSGIPELPHVDSWLGGIRQAMRLHQPELAAIADDRAKYERLVELNVAEQVYNLSTMATVRAAWAAKRTLRLHGWMYRLEDGLIRDLGCNYSSVEEAERAHRVG
jgi:carbonic anhydrase